jgi:hypothetical protein
MFKFEDLDEFTSNMVKGLSQEGSVIVNRLKSGGFAIIPGIKKDSPSVMSTESGLVLSQEGLADWEGADYLFIPEGSLGKEE